MSEHAPPAVPGDAAVGPEQARLSPERIDALLADFRSWLEQTAPPPPPEPAGPTVDLHTLLGQFVALRHEVNLQTKANRIQQEQSAEALRQLGAALDELERRDEAAEQARQQAGDEQTRPLLKALVDVYDALSLARREVQRVQEAMGPALEKMEALAEVPEESEPPSAPPLPARAAGPASAASRRTLWEKWFVPLPQQAAPAGAPVADQRPDAVPLWREAFARQRQQLQSLRTVQGEARQAAEQARRFIESVVTGYTMSVQRLDRALQQQGLEPIPCLGLPFDPETMEVVEVVPGAGRASTEVVEEVRRGYRWRDRLFRFAQVRVAKP